MQSEKVFEYDSDSIPVNEFWNDSKEKEPKIHKIHYYPAKFPAFIVDKSLKIAKEKKIQVSTIADIFCGCGTTAFESRRQGINFWGCDINPVATLIARVKSETYQKDKLEGYFQQIVENNKKVETPQIYGNNERINYWFPKSQINKLYSLLKSINKNVPKGKYREFFLCAFSNILKPSSRWLTKSIKPQIDPNKKLGDVDELFSKQVNTMIKAIEEEGQAEKRQKANIQIKTQDYLQTKVRKPFVDMVVTSPPYVTSYEYADLHQLSSLWLYPKTDYKSLRKGSIGTVYHTKLRKAQVLSLNEYAQKLHARLAEKSPTRAKSVMKYFYDLKKTVEKTKSILKPGGLAIFVIGNTEYAGVTVDNANYLRQCLLEVGIKKVEINKRIIKGKILSPYRDRKGRFSNNSADRKVYRYEYVIIAEND